jgi:hypothetical protein
MNNQPLNEGDTVETVLNAVVIGVLVFTCSVAIVVQGAHVFAS